MTKTIVGLVERVTLIGPGGERTVLARIDTGATRSSIDAKLADELRAGPAISTMKVRSAHGVTRRSVIAQKVIIGGRRMLMKFNIAERGAMKYKVLIGQNILKRGFLIDPGKEL
jgi:hypothetical protein